MLITVGGMHTRNNVISACLLASFLFILCHHHSCEMPALECCKMTNNTASVFSCGQETSSKL